MDKKEVILEAARESFSVFGYKATTMDQVAKTANVGKGTIYNFFQNKEELFQKIIADLLHEMKKKAESVMDDHRSLKENVHLALVEILQYRKSHQLTVKLVYEAREMGTATVREALQSIETSVLDYLKGKITAAVAEGDIRECDPEITAFMMLKLYMALIIDWEEGHEPLTKEKILHLFDDYVFKGLSPD